MDGLSRCDHLPEPEVYEEAEQAEYVQAMEDESFLNIVAQMEEGLDIENLLKAQREDKYLQQVAEWIANGKVFTISNPLCYLLKIFILSLCFQQIFCIQSFFHLSYYIQKRLILHCLNLFCLL